jgi:hypothetical protein
MNHNNSSHILKKEENRKMLFLILDPDSENKTINKK